MNKCTYIDGIASSQAIDTAGEVVDLSGLDISSLVGAAFNWEHLKDTPSQIVGKILECKKIFSEKDCENDRHIYYWNKCGIPFLYVMGRLFDDKKPSSVEAAALFKDDADHPGEPDMVGFSVEGAQISKSGMVIKKSIARKVTITHIPANKTCLAEMLPTNESKKDDIDSLFKSEKTFKLQGDANLLESLEKKEMKKEIALSGVAPTSSMFASESLKKAIPGAPPAPKAPVAPSMPKAPVAPSMPKAPSAPKMPHGWMQVKGSKSPGVHFEHPEHGIISAIKQPSGEFHVKMGGTIVGHKGVSGIHSTVESAGKHLHNVMTSISRGTQAAPKMRNFSSSTSGGASFTKNELNKALDAGSSMAAPSQLTQGAALAKEDICVPKKTMVEEHKELLSTLKHPTDKKLKQEAKKQSKELKEYKKSQWLSRAEEEYASWSKKEKFREFMKKRLPKLALSEIDAIGQTIALHKALKSEKALNKMLGNESFQGSFVPKTEEIHGEEPLMKPYASDAQRRWAHTEAGKKALGGESAVHEWDKATKGKKLPEKVSKSEDKKDCGCEPDCKCDCSKGCKCHPMKKTSDIMMASEKNKK